MACAKRRVLSDNLGFRSACQVLDVYMYEVAEAAGIADSTLSRWLRWVLTGEQERRLRAALRQLAFDRGQSPDAALDAFHDGFDHWDEGAV